MHIYTLESIRNLGTYPTIYFSCEDTPLGTVWIASTSFGVCKLTMSTPGEQVFLSWLGQTFSHSDFVYDGDRHKPVVKTLTDYAAGQKLTLDLPIHLLGTDFQLRVWQELLNIPYGETVTYSELAVRLGSHPRAIGHANAKNPVAIFVPCHRVVGAGGKLTGYAGGIELKAVLLELEATSKFISACQEIDPVNAKEPPPTAFKC